MRKRTQPSDKAAMRVALKAEEQAAELGRRVPWQILLETRNQYLEWQEFYFWARSIMECETHIPNWLKRILKLRCPGFLDSQRKDISKYGDAAICATRLGEWIDQHVFSFAAQGGWLPAVTFYAVREPRYGKVVAHWSESVRNWRVAGRPGKYPPFDEWVRDAQRSDETAHLLPEKRKRRECFKLVQPDRLREAVARYIDLEALAYWARPALENNASVVPEVRRELDGRCPGFSDFDRKARDDKDLPYAWGRLMVWVRDHFFSDAKEEGWYEAILLSARIHPRAIRTMEYADHCDEVWRAELPVPYPAFQTWRQHADRYLDLWDL